MDISFFNVLTVATFYGGACPFCASLLPVPQFSVELNSPSYLHISPASAAYCRRCRLFCTIEKMNFRKINRNKNILEAFNRLKFSRMHYAVSVAKYLFFSRTVYRIIFSCVAMMRIEVAICCSKVQAGCCHHVNVLAVPIKGFNNLQINFQIARVAFWSSKIETRSRRSRPGCSLWIAQILQCTNFPSLILRSFLDTCSNDGLSLGCSDQQCFINDTMANMTSSPCVAGTLGRNNGGLVDETESMMASATIWWHSVMSSFEFLVNFKQKLR